MRSRATKAMKLAETVAALPSEGGTNLEAALELAFEKAREHQEANAQNRIVLLTDGAANLGDAKAESLGQRVEMMREGRDRLRRGRLRSRGAQRRDPRGAHPQEATTVFCSTAPRTPARPLPNRSPEPCVPPRRT